MKDAEIRNLAQSIDLGDGGFCCQRSAGGLCYEHGRIVKAIEQALAEQLEESKKIYRKFAIHMSHCNFGEHSGECKYGDDDCPALTESWSWFGRALDRKRHG